MELLVLGCGAGMPAEGMPGSGYLVSTRTCRLLLDCGPGVAVALSGNGGATTLDAIFISHLHPDHCYDLLPIGTTLVRTRPGSRTPVYAPSGTRAMLERLAAVYPLQPEPIQVKPFHEAFTVVEYRPGSRIELGDCTLTPYALRHVVPNCGIRIHDGSATLAYTGDTGRTDALTDLARGVDLLLAEATYDVPADGHDDYGHLSTRDAAQVAAAAGVGRLVLTHLSARARRSAAVRRADATAIFTGPIHTAEPGARYQI